MIPDITHDFDAHSAPPFTGARPNFYYEDHEPHHIDNTKGLGRFPGNVALVHDAACTPDGCAESCPVALLDAQAGESVSRSGGIAGWQKGGYVGGKYAPIERTGYDDLGGASRFFYTAKASGVERVYLQDGAWKRVSHPTLKPIQLIEWLATLLLPPQLDTPRRLFVPFSGVGSEMIGAHLAGWDVIDGVEQSAAYIAEGKARAAWWGKYTSYDKALDAYATAQEVKRAADERKAAGVEQLKLFGEDVA